MKNRFSEGALTFSIVIPVYNRAELVRRAIGSCLRQRYDGFEVVVVDDGSTDGSSQSVEAFADPRIRLIRQPVNRGVSAARNLAIEHCRGEWIVCLDSDDELAADALVMMARDLRSAPADVAGFRFMCRLDDGSLSPVPPLTNAVWNYAEYLQWAQQVTLHGRQETFFCARRSTFAAVRFPEGRALESLYHLDFAARFRSASSPAVVRLYHSDAPDQLTRPDPLRALATAADHARAFEALLDRHGAALLQHAPALWLQYSRGLALQHFLAGSRLAGMRRLALVIKTNGLSMSMLATLGLGLLGRRILAYAQARRIGRRAARGRRRATGSRRDAPTVDRATRTLASRG